jgi:hypothetical protein
MRPLLNVNSMSSQMFPESAFNKNQLDSEKLFRNTKGSLYDSFSQYLAENYGNPYRNDWADVSPEVMKYWVQTLTGGAGKFVVDSLSGADIVRQGGELDLREMPFARKAMGEIDVRGARSQFFKRAEEATTALEEYKLAAKKDMDYALSFRTENDGLLRMARVADRYKEAAKAQREAQDALKRDDSIPVAEKRLQLKELERQEMILYNRFSAAWKEALQKE